jgi:regulator of replication initiation timing
MGEVYYSEFNINHEELYAEMERLKSENYHLKRQLSHKQNINRGQSKHIATLEKKLKAVNKSKQHYRNGRKRGANGFNG